LRYRATTFAIALTMNKGIDYWISYSFTRPSSLHLKAKFVKKDRARTIVSTWRKQAPITYESLGLLQGNKDIRTPLEQANKMMSRFLLLRPSFTKKEMFKKFTKFFQQYANTHPMYSMLHTANLGFCNYFLFSQIRSHMLTPSKHTVCYERQYPIYSTSNHTVEHLKISTFWGWSCGVVVQNFVITEEVKVHFSVQQLWHFSSITRPFGHKSFKLLWLFY